MRSSLLVQSRWINHSREKIATTETKHVTIERSISSSTINEVFKSGYALDGVSTLFRPRLPKQGGRSATMLDSSEWQVSEHLLPLLTSLVLIYPRLVWEHDDFRPQCIGASTRSPAARVVSYLPDALLLICLHLDSAGISLSTSTTVSQRNMHVLQSCGPIGDALSHAMHAILPPLLAGLGAARELLVESSRVAVCTLLR